MDISWLENNEQNQVEPNQCRNYGKRIGESPFSTLHQEAMVFNFFSIPVQMAKFDNSGLFILSLDIAKFSQIECWPWHLYQAKN